MFPRSNYSHTTNVNHRLMVTREKIYTMWKIGRVVEYGGLENRYTSNRIIGPNPIFSASSSWTTIHISSRL